MAAKGLHLDRMSRYFGWFNRGEPMAHVRFRLEPLTKSDDSLTPEERAGYQEMGWEYLDTWENLYRIFRADDPAAPEFHTDPKTQALTLDRIIRKSAVSWLIVLGIFAMFWAFLFWQVVLPSPTPFYDFIRVSFVFVDLPVLGVALFLFFDRGGLLDLLALRRALRRGEPQPHPRVRRLGVPAGLLGLILTFLPFVVNFTIALADFPHYRTVTDPAGLPYVSLVEIENDPNFERITDARPSWGQDFFHSYERLFGLLMPEHTLTRQYGKDEGRQWAYVGETAFREDEYLPDCYNPQLHITRARLLTQGLAMRVYDDLEGALYEGDTLPVDQLTLDEAICRTSVTGYGAPCSQLLLRDGRTVLEVSYYGEADLAEHLGEFTPLLT